MSPFPSDLIPDILCWLPVKTLLRLKCVSKPWRSLIDDPHFAKLHLDYSLRTSTCVECDDKAYAVDFDSLDNLVHSLALSKSRYLLPLDDDIANDHDSLPGNHYDKNTVLGFGYDEISNDYKVVKMLRSKTQNSFKVMVYSLKADSWKRIDDFPYDFPTNYNDGAYVNNALHWVGDEIGEFHGGQVIFTLDLATEKYYDVPEGDTSFKIKKCGGDCPYFGYMNAGVLGGCLCVSRDYSTCPVEDHINVWVVKEYGVKESWTELLYLSRDQWLTNIFHTRAVGYSKNGDKVLLDDGGGRQPAWFNLENETGETLRIAGAPQLVSTTIYVESLVSV
ncbi:Pyridoxal phosphate phosphatase-related protein [Hibiscus syriacus]|uniref:Pyridoxal phosphate phosphatase-related protein n=1 Tax=Hibiscus syriacus TaxID=106335 RepID=A0A6A3B9Y4_HIBSY|nr:Pyridoxal phosphate phosphatase-related protein [Hibiscus syriacus]